MLVRPTTLILVVKLEGSSWSAIGSPNLEIFLGTSFLYWNHNLDRGENGRSWNLIFPAGWKKAVKRPSSGLSKVSEGSLKMNGSNRVKVDGRNSPKWTSSKMKGRTHESKIDSSKASKWAIESKRFKTIWNRSFSNVTDQILWKCTVQTNNCTL